MKTCKLLLLFVAFSAMTFYSCADSNPIENENTTQRSIALRTVLNQIKAENGIAGRNTAAFCFDFVYPLTFSFNSGTTVTVSSFEGLLDILANENPNLYLEGIDFPFQVMQGGLVVTIDSEEEFTALLEDCGLPTWNDDLQNTFCFDLVFPINVELGGQIVTINSYTEFNAFMNNPANGNELQIVFPISVLYNGETVVINNTYEFYEMVNNCNNDCICTQDYAPVCVETPSGVVVEFGNMCYAICAGYSQNDLVNCNPMSECNIENVEITVGACNPDYSYALTINFTYMNPGSEQFVVYNSANIVVGTYNLADLPITIPNYVSNTNATDYLSINIIGGTCNEFYQWILPDCGCNCGTELDPVCIQTPTGIVTYDNMCLAECVGYTANDVVPCGTYNFGQLLGTCFSIEFPVGIQTGGAIVTVNSNGEVLQYWNPAQGPMPAFNYPITVWFAILGSPVVIENQAEFEAMINQFCN